MEYRTLARTGVQVSPLCLGAMMFGAWGETDHDECVRIVHRALDAGINFIDTADVYSRGESETIVGKALAGGRRDDVVLATKFHGTMGDDANEAGNSRRWIFREVESSLRRLGTDWIDLYQVHRWDPWTDHEETLGALSDLVAQGKVRYLGSSTFPAAQIVKAQWVARERGLQRYVCEQPPYSLLARGVEADVLPACLEHGMGTITWSPLAGGWLSGRWRKGVDGLTSRRSAMIPARYDLSLPANQAKLDAADALGKLADEAGADARPHGGRVRHPPPRGHRGNHRATHDGAARVPARRRRPAARGRSARPHRRDRRSRHDDQPGRCGMVEPGAEAGRPPSVEQVPGSLAIRPSRSGGPQATSRGHVLQVTRNAAGAPQHDWAYRKTYRKRVPLQKSASLLPSEAPCERFSELGT